MGLTRRGRAVFALGLLVVFAAIVGGGGFVYLRSIGLAGESDPGGRVEVVVPRGASASEIGELLERQGVIRSAWGFRLAAYIEGGGDAIEAGRHVLRRGLTARDALAALLQGARVDYVTVTFPEGSWVTDFARILGGGTDLSARRFLALTRSGEVRSSLQPQGTRSLEGLLWPATYQVGRRDDERSLLERLVAEMEQRVEGLDRASARRAGVSVYELVTIASMVEAEAKVDADRRRIAAVIYNRLELGMPLGIDATIAYALGRRGGSLGAEDLAVDSPYNTRLRQGLPPTPIGAPGLESLEAAARPGAGEWLYYVVSDCRGHHAFSESYEQFLEDKDAYQELEC
jgi:peptidoglycan lytic transglycosylase G